MPNQTPIVLPPSRPGMDPDILKQLLETIVPIVVAAAKQPEVQSAFKLLLPKVLGALGLSVPGIGIIGMVASFVIPALLPDLMGSPTQTSTGVATFASSAGVFGIGIVNLLKSAKSAIDKIGDRVRQ